MSESHTNLELELVSDAEAAADEEALAPGEIVAGKYVIKRALGKGGTGTVYEAQHVTVGHRVALKIVNASRLDRPETIARFQQEARICGAIRHPNIGQIYDVGTLDHGQPYMVLELHEGRSLADVLDESILPIPAVIEIARQVLAGLSAVHHAGIVHRDVKPDNAMLVRTLNGDIVVKLVDFGISKIIRADIQERAITRANSILGSPDYMSPEQLRGQEVDGRTDLYAVGVLLYEAITGRTPFDGENITDLMAAIVRDPVQPPSELRPECPRELEQLIMKAISRDAAGRFESADEMSRQLAEVQRVVRYVPDPGIARLREPMQRRSRSSRTTRARGPRAMPHPAPAALPSAESANGSVSTPLSISEERSSPFTTTSRAMRRRPNRLVIAAVIAACGLLIFAVGAAWQGEAPAPQAAAVGEPSIEAPAPAIEVAQVQAQAPVDQAPVDDVAEPMGAPEPEPKSEAATPKRSARGKRAHRAARAQAQETSELTPEAKPAPDAPAPGIAQLMDEATAAFVLGQMPRARALYQQVLDRAPNRADAWRGLGLAASRMGQRNDAVHAFDRYLALRPDAADAERIREQLEKLR